MSGTVTVEGTTLTEATVEADLTALVSDEPRRDGRIQEALETERFPTATFTLTEPVELGADPTTGAQVSATAVGELTVHGVTRPVEVPLEAAFVDGLVVVTGSVDVTISDVDVTAPTAPIVLSVADTATVELQRYLSPAS